MSEWVDGREKERGGERGDFDGSAKIVLIGGAGGCDLDFKRRRER